MSKRAVATGLACVGALAWGAMEYSKGDLTVRPVRSADREWQPPVAIEKQPPLPATPTTQKVAPPAAPEEVALMARALQGYDGLYCPAGITGGDVMIIGRDKYATPLCINPAGVALQSTVEASWLQMPVAVAPSDLIGAPDIRETFLTAPDQMCKDAAQVGGRLALQLMQQVDPRAGEGKAYTVQIVFGDQPSACDQAPPVMAPVIEESVG